jgi:hypothetical protein
MAFDGFFVSRTPLPVFSVASCCRGYLPGSDVDRFYRIPLQ